MARGTARTPSFVFLSFVLLLICFATGGMQSVQGQVTPTDLIMRLTNYVVVALLQKTWCVAKPSSDEATLLGNINYACSQVDCSVLQRGRTCFYPDNLMSHASIAMNLYYQSRGRNPWNCFFKNSGLVVATDPSYGSCGYA
ncbi:glucan endo-1,3-beta-D-glucosidase isoform X1 [Musa acuminata AAA Group]|uniref:glucan endo-1,3-beta-D-glucosidase isoform X1 n=1 Tax=Musa acuminata AAA Group TaxID=214697 RepID=UPI0031D9F88F